MIDGVEIDRYITIIGSGATGLFCLFLFLQIRDARRHVPTDSWLAVTALSWAIICGYGTVRLITNQLTIPYISTVLWSFVLVSVAGTTYHMRRERRMTIAERRAERSRLERLDVSDHRS
jgi:CHASE2 domain-containing sensor protein